MSFPVERIRIATSELSNTIFIGRVNAKENLWLDKRDCTEEAIAAVRDHLFAEIEDGKDMAGYRWSMKDGRTIDLLVKVRDGEVEEGDDS